jgi:hypothetical protein
MGAQEVDRKRLHLELLEHVAQFPFTHERRNHVREKRAEPEAVDAGLDRRVGQVASHRTGKRHLVRLRAKLHSARGARPVNRTQRCSRSSCRRRGVPCVRRYAGLAHTTRRTRPTGIATSEESPRWPMRTAASTPSAPGSLPDRRTAAPARLRDGCGRTRSRSEQRSGARTTPTRSPPACRSARRGASAASPPPPAGVATFLPRPSPARRALGQRLAEHAGAAQAVEVPVARR